MSVTLRPWRDPDGRIAQGEGRVWIYCADHTALDHERGAAPRDGELVECLVAAPGRLRGLERRDRLPFEFALVRWLGSVVDPELDERAAATALPAELRDPVLGTFTLRAAPKWYEAKRTALGGAHYRFVVQVEDAGPPAACLERARPVAAWVEPEFASIVSIAAERMFDLWNDAWRQDEEDEEDIVDAKSFATRLSIESVHWNPAKSVDDVVVGLDDGHLFGDHGIDVRMVGRKIVDVQMG